MPNLPLRARSSAGLGLAILAFVNLFNYLDRFVVSALFESLKHSELALSDFKLGFLMTSFLIVYMLTAPVFGVLGDRRSRPRLIAFGVACWSVATTLSGFAGSYLALLAARATVGIGEAAYGTIAPSLLADYFPAPERGRVMAIFFCAIPVGSALGYVVGGLMDVHFGWRAAFFVAGVPGLVLAALCLKLRDPPRGTQDAGGAVIAPRGGAPEAVRTTYRHLIGNTAYLLTILGYAGYTFAVGGLASWMPAFLERVRGMPRSQATVSFGAMVVITGFVGTFAGGWLGDYCAKYSRQALLWLSAFATLAAVPLVWVALTAGSPRLYLISMVAALLLLFVSTGPVNAVIVNLVSPTERASAVALSVFTIHLLGDVLSPPLIGALSDATSLAAAVRIVPFAVLVAGVLWCWAARAQWAAQPAAARAVAAT
ncbi:MAG: MFS transporter [Steroidobacteraceae bacterium]|jgi:MFS family permease